MKIVLKQQWQTKNILTTTIYSIGLNPVDISKNLHNLKNWISTIKCKFGLIVIDNSKIKFAAVDHLANLLFRRVYN